MHISLTAAEIRHEAVWGYVGAPRSLAHATLDNYRPGCDQQVEALGRCRVFVSQGLENIAHGRGLLLKGPVGTGKSHLAVATVRTLIEAHPQRFGKPFSSFHAYEDVEYGGYRCSMIPVFELLERLRESYGSRGRKKDYAELIRRCKGDDLVILDDIGAEKPTEWVEEQFYGLIDHRYRAQLCTFLTTNCSMTELEGRIGKRALSRIMEMCEGVAVGGDDWRKTHSQGLSS